MTKVKISARAYHSTSQFRDVIRTVTDRTRYLGRDENGQVMYDPVKELPTVQYKGTVKVHGTNGSLIKFADGRIYRQSKSRILDITHDNSGFFEAMFTVPVEQLFDKVEAIFTEKTGKEVKYPIEIAGEWAGKGIQSGVAVSNVPKFFMIFGVNVGMDNADEQDYGWQALTDYATVELPEARIFNSLRFGFWTVNINFNRPQDIQNTLVELTHQVEAECPVGKALGELGIGEGIVWVPVAQELAKHTGLWFKCKGQKHSVSKVKTVAAIDPQKMASIDEFVDYAVTTNRLEQGAQEVGLDMKKVGEFIGWVNRDIFKEEADVLAASALTMRDVGKPISDVARKFYLSKLAQ